MALLERPDGLTNAQEAAAGTNPYAADTDGDGLADGLEALDGVRLDTDGDGLVDGADLDTDGDGTLDARDDDTDGDGTSDWRDPDDDGDGLPTAIERGDTATLDPDLDDDGTPAWLDTDADGDGQLDSVEGRGDTDLDGLPDYLDPDDGDGGSADSDDDGLTNIEEATLGTNPLNADSDADGLDDATEVGENVANPIDSDGNGRIDALSPDDDGDGVPTRREREDAVGAGEDPDDDALPSWRDPDSDGDSISDRDEAGVDGLPVDTDGDTKFDYLDTDTDTDTDEDRRLDRDEAGDADLATPPVDSDDDEVADFRDNDADNDGVPDGTDNCPFTANPGQEDTGDLGIGDACRHAPVLDPIGPRTTPAGTALTFTVRAVDEDSDIVSLSVEGLPEGAAFDPGTGVFEWTPTLAQLGSVELTVRVTDRGGLTDVEVVTITVTDPNTAPVVVAPGVVAGEEETGLTARFDVSDPDGDEVTCALTPLPQGASYDDSTRTLTWLPPEDADRSYALSLTCTDGHATTTASVNVVIEDVVYTRAGGGLMSRAGCTSAGDPTWLLGLIAAVPLVRRRRRARPLTPTSP